MRQILPALLAAAAVVTLGSEAAAQQATYTFFGDGHSWPMVVRDVPRLGRVFVVESASRCVGGADGSRQSFVLTGGSNTSFGGLPLPCDLRRFGLPIGGLLRVSVVHVAEVSGECVDELGPAVFAIPRERSLLGVSFYQQVLGINCHQEGCSYSLSRAGHGVIGR